MDRPSSGARRSQGASPSSNVTDQTNNDTSASVAAALQLPETYPADERPESIEVRETPSAIVFLAGDHAYKMKKPVDFGFLNFTDLDRRRYFCYQEVFLNQRIAPDIYRAVVSVAPDGAGGYKIGAEDDPSAVEYLVQMIRLPEDKMLNARLDRGDVTADMLRDLGHIIADFHNEAQTDDAIAAAGDLEGVRFNVEENFSQTAPFIGRTISQETYDAVSTYARRFMDLRSTLFHTRAAQGFVKDSHGDLHTQQICIEDNGRISVLDCIDFNERFRYGDTASDAAFMAMDLEARGRPDLARAFVDGYLERADDPGITELLPFYQCYRAYVRGKVDGFRLDQPSVSAQEAAEVTARANAYFLLAAAYARTAVDATIVLTGGLMGTGKSTLARGLARERGHAYLSTDVIRKEILGVPQDERHFDSWNTGLYSPELSGRTYSEVARRAEALLAQGRSVVVDGSFSRKHDRARFRALPRTSGAPLLLVLCELPEEEARARLDARVEAGGVPTDGRWEIYAQQRDAFEPPEDFPAGDVLHLDASASPEEVLRNLIARLDANEQ